MERTWQTLGEVAPEGLVDARLQLHHAAQIVAALGTSLLPPMADYSHTSLEWLAGPGVLASGLAAGEHPLRAALRLSDLTLLLLDGDERIIADFMLNGHTLTSGLDWLRQQVSAFGLDGARVAPPTYQPGEFPDHAVGEGKPFVLDPSSFAELSRYYADADMLLRELQVGDPRASTVRVWPHHFDIATLINLDAGGGEEARSVGAGLSPGDGGYPQPYFYVTPWPYPATDKLPALPSGGTWHTEGWVGGVLTAAALIGGDVAGQMQRAQQFLQTVVSESIGLLANQHE